MKKFYNEIADLRGVAIILVVLGHVLSGLSNYFQLSRPSALGAITAVIYTFHMPIFFFISGFLFVDKANYWEFVQKKISRFFLPYLSFSFLLVLNSNLFGSAVNTRIPWTSLPELFVKPISILWYLQIIFLIFLVAPLLKKGNPLLILGGALIWSLTTFSVAYPDVVGLVGYYLFYFQLGVVVNSHYANLKKVFRNWGVVALGLFVLLAGSYVVRPEPVLKYFIVVTALAFLLAGFIQLRRRTVLARILQPISNFSFEIYLLHTFFTAGSRIFLTKILGLHNLLELTVILTLAGIVFPLLIAKYLINKSRLFRTVLFGYQD